MVEIIRKQEELIAHQKETIESLTKINDILEKTSKKKDAVISLLEEKNSLLEENVALLKAGRDGYKLLVETLKLRIKALGGDEE